MGSRWCVAPEVSAGIHGWGWSLWDWRICRGNPIRATFPMGCGMVCHLTILWLHVPSNGWQATKAKPPESGDPWEPYGGPSIFLLSSHMACLPVEMMLGTLRDWARSLKAPQSGQGLTLMWVMSPFVLTIRPAMEQAQLSSQEEPAPLERRKDVWMLHQRWVSLSFVEKSGKR